MVSSGVRNDVGRDNTSWAMKRSTEFFCVLESVINRIYRQCANDTVYGIQLSKGLLRIALCRLYVFVIIVFDTSHADHAVSLSRKDNINQDTPTPNRPSVDPSLPSRLEFGFVSHARALGQNSSHPELWEGESLMNVWGF